MLATSLPGIIAIVFVCMMVFTYAVNSLGRSAQVARGRNKCQACGSRLKKVGAGYAGTCSKCGQKQPWAT